ncbi:MAG: hypothetical protein JF609_07060 [Verrucomicrobia bacterium]|nr:hypothetical protein [Verrucomicrobiota bacterium]
MKTTLKILCALGLVAVGTVLTSQAATIDVTTIGSSGSVGSAYFFGIDPQSTGTGVIDPFLREQNNGSELGVNTSAGTPFDDKGGPWTHDLAISSLASVNYLGTSYYQFYLDANQIGNGTISMTTLKIFTSATALGTVSAVTTLVGGAGAVYDLGANVVNIAGNNGSGSGDMLMYIPASLIGTTGYLYLYAGFGVGDGNFQSNDGFEEWHAVEGANSVPDAANTVSLFGMTLVGLAAFRAKFKKA